MAVDPIVGAATLIIPFQDQLAFAPLLRHATARPRRGGTLFESQATPVGRRLWSQPAGTSQRYGPDALPSRPSRNA